MSYPRFTKIIIDYFMLKDLSISRINKMFWHTARDDTMFTSMRCISRHEDTQVYGTILPKELTNQAMLESNAYKTYYAFASGEKAPKSKYVRKKVDPNTSPKQKLVQASKGTRLKLKAKVDKSDKKKQRVKKPKAKGLAVLSKVALTEAEQIKLATKRSKKDFHMSHISGSGDRVDIQSKVPDEQQQKTSGTDEETDSEDEDDNDDDGNNDDDGDSDDDNDKSDDEMIECDRDKIPDPKKTNEENNEEEEEYDDEFNIEEEEKINDEETMDEEEDDEVTKELYDDVNVNLGNEDTDMTNVDQAENEIASLMETSAHHATTVPKNTSSFTVTIPLPPPFFNPLLQQATPTPILITSEATTSFPSLLDFAYVFKFNERVFNLEKDVEAINKAILAHNLDCRQEAQDEKNAYIELVGTSMRALIKEEVNTQLSQILPQAVSDFATPVIEKNVTESVEVAVLTRSSSQPMSTYEAVASLSEFELTKILMDKMEKNKSYDKADYKKKLYDALVESYNTNKDLFDSYGEVFSLKRTRDDSDKDRDPSAGSNRGKKRRKSNNDEQPVDKEVTKADWFKKPERPPTPDPDWSKRQQVDFRAPQTWISQVACAEEPPTLFDELNDSSFDFSGFVLNRLKIPNLTQEILVGPAFNLLKGTCKSITELEYHL
ncbi:hypothetical protein Tco_1245469 [Tanacetum coccineum]